MTRTVKFVDVTVKEVPCVNLNEYRYHSYSPQDFAILPSCEEAIAAECINYVTEHVVPICKFVEQKDDSRDEWYVAYSQETEKVFNFSINSLLKQINIITDDKMKIDCENSKLSASVSIHAKHLDQVIKSGFWRRIKYAITGKPRHITDYLS